MIFCASKNMSSFYLSDPKVLNELKLLDEDFRIYQHCCKQFNVKTLNSFVRVVDIAGQFQLTTEQVQLSLARLSRIRVEGLPLITVRQKDHYLTFDMPRHREFVKQIGFAKFNSSKGWKALRGCIQNVASKKKYKFEKLDQWELLDKLTAMSAEEFAKIKASDLAYPWMYTNAKKIRSNS
jgi:hypothetical protein